MKIEEHDVVRLKDGREAVVLSGYETGYLVEIVGRPPDEFDGITDDDIELIIWKVNSQKTNYAP